MLLGRMGAYRGTQREGDLYKGDNLEKLERFCQQWWVRWQQAAELLFTPRRKWLQARRNLRVGDIVMLLGERKLGPAKYRLARVAELYPDSDGLVRTVSIALRSRRGGGTKVEQQPMAVQRLAVILPAEEKWNEGLAHD